jgi:hypothetical protein
MECYTEDQAFSRFGSSPTLPYPSPVSKLDQRHTGRLRKRGNLLTSDGGKGVGKEPNHTSTRKPFPLDIYSILSAFDVQESGMSLSLRNCVSDIKNDETEYINVHIYRYKYSCGSSLYHLRAEMPISGWRKSTICILYI